MSCFLVTEDCLNRAVWAMVAHKDNGRISYRWSMCEHGPDADGNFTKPSQADLLGREMYDLNLKAFATRYNEPIEDYPESPQLTFRFDQAKSISPIQALKALQCVIYQCSEGKELMESAIYEKMREAELRLAMFVVEDLPEYQDAKWG